ncbi:MAG: hypothetical protein K9N46_05400 [Candidatus Marinimicrobia bacterium]|nr:hypothetical protein [Candidatus Neomarinimicrobiota bacterium]MCF7880158.1 hypothetical protein [Candidatus Neomarinimicrobiota bacterium]
MRSTVINICTECPFFTHTYAGKPACAAKHYIPEIPWPQNILTNHRELRLIPVNKKMAWTNTIDTRPDWCPLPITIRKKPPKIKNTLADLRLHKKRLEATRDKVDEELAKTSRAIARKTRGASPDIDALAEEIATALESRPKGMSRTVIYRDLYSNNIQRKFIEQALKKLEKTDRAIGHKIPTKGRSREVWFSTTSAENTGD